MANRGSVRHVAMRALLLGVLLLLACGGSRFPTPYYRAGGPPFISPKGHSLWRGASALGARTPSYRVILIGDAGATRPEEATLSDLGLWAEDLVDRTAVVFLGDNLYPSGLGEGDERGEGILLQQLRATRARKIFVPGNHDWGNVIPSAATVWRPTKAPSCALSSPVATIRVVLVAPQSRAALRPASRATSSANNALCRAARALSKVRFTGPSACTNSSCSPSGPLQ